MEKYPSLRAFTSYVSSFKRPFWLTVCVFALADVAISLVPWLIGRFTQSLTSHDGNISAWTIALIVASIGHDILWRGAEIMYMTLLLGRSHRFDDVVFNEVTQHDYSYFVDKFTGKISSYANSLGREFREMLDNFCYQYVNLLVALPIIAATMFSVNVYTGVIFVICLILMFFVGRVLARKAAAAERIVADNKSTIDGYVVDAIANFVSVKAFGSERREARRLYTRRQTLIDAAYTSFYRDIWFWGVMSIFVRWIIWPSTFVLNVYLFTHGKINLSQMTTFLSAIVLFSGFIWEVIWNISQLNIKIAGIEEAYRYLFGTRNIVTEPSDVAVESVPSVIFNESLELRGVNFAYPDKPDVPVLKNINIQIRHGEKIGIVGPSGGGKSTLLKLLLGYYAIPSETLFIDGRPTSNTDMTSLLAYVPQDTSIFHRSIRENIAYARPDATEEDIITAAKHAQAHEFISALETGYDTLVGERGVKLSGGQRQRIAIARALLKDAPLLLLDEATSALDSESEQLVQTALDELLVGHTAIVIAHRLSTIQKMDRIIVLDNGAVVEEGTHSELLEKQGIYARLWAHQSGGFIEE